MEHHPALEPEYVEMFRQLFEEMVPFNRFIGLKVTRVDVPHCECRFVTKPELIGNFSRQILHGGVLASAIDAAGGLGVFAAMSLEKLDMPWPERLHLFAKVGTIDLRIDYLEPAAGPHFTLRSDVVRIGKRVGTVRIDAFDHHDKRVAIGTATFRLG